MNTTSTLDWQGRDWSAKGYARDLANLHGHNWRRARSAPWIFYATGSDATGAHCVRCGTACGIGPMYLFANTLTGQRKELRRWRRGILERHGGAQCPV